MHPTYKETQAARKIVTLHRVAPSRVTPADLAKALRTIKARGQYISESMRKSPKVQARRARSAASKTIRDPFDWLVADARSAIDRLRASADPRAPDELAALVEYIQGW